MKNKNPLLRRDTALLMRLRLHTFSCFFFALVFGILVPSLAYARVLDPKTVGPWPLVAPENLGIKPDKLARALDYIQSNAGDDGISQTLILHGNKAVFAGSRVDVVHNVYSVTKSFTSTALALLIAENKATLDTLICDIDAQYCDAYPQVSLRHLATMTSGYNASGENRWQENSEDWSVTPFASGTPLFPPGTAFAYWDEAMIVFGDVLTQLAQQSLYDYLNEKLMQPMQITNWKWWHETNRPHGYTMNYGAGGIELSAIDLAKYGSLMLNGGKWQQNGEAKRLISKQWVEAASRNQIPLSIKTADTDRKSIDGVGYYGFNWWVNGVNASGQRQMPNAPSDTYYARGFNNNMLFIIPQWNMVIVRMGMDDEKRIDKVAFYNEFFGLLREAVE
ncbi:serine hydrolase domain-containing protein [Glaciecola siphonariae]|uniref:Serine hydrolase domain-containing protein n=1 Tax=Glaciecola siphonariae TaxID=521012 RepID=A0ABV9LUU1_9ALTE